MIPATDVHHLLALAKLDSIGPITAKSLIGYCGSAAAVFETKAHRLLKIPGVGEAGARAIANADPQQLMQPDWDWIQKQDVRIITYLDADYPQRLKQIPESPIILFYRGSANLNARRAIALVGTRKPSPYGVAMAQRILEELQQYRPLVISGLAFGIDATAHRMALDLGLPTLGVLGHGLDIIYPAVHRKLARTMEQNGGGLLTEFPIQSRIDKEHFPMRNRIIAAMSEAVVVIESKERGGSIITAEFANAYHREVFALPGRTSDPLSQGCNALIKRHKAALIESGQDIAFQLGWTEEESGPSRQMNLFLALEPDEEAIYQILRTHPQADIDQLAYLSGMGSSTLATVMLHLEFKGIVKSAPGKRFILV
ncbi:MAG: DNA-processing protein DprA [Saprospiraceae bacterium]|nr:DNA-processing protein DprA [Saprospiraceae bacterium]